jgi:lysophospholipase L1-like esterase
MLALPPFSAGGADGGRCILIPGRPLMLVRRRVPFLVLALFGAAALPAAEKTAPAQQFCFKDGDRVVMIGDSITEQRLYSTYVQMWTVTRFPTWKITFRNVGIGGDVSPGGNGRFKRDVLAYQPTALTVDFGMNDAGYGGVDPKRFARYMGGLQGIADQARAANIRVAWITPQPVEAKPGDKFNTYNKTLEHFSAGVKEIAAKNHGLFIDQFHGYQEVIDKAHAAEKMRITDGDAVHPGEPGQALMAGCILRGMHFPRLVSRVSITLNQQGLPDVRTQNCKISELGGKQPEGKEFTQARFTRMDNALPFFPEKAKSILKWAPLLTELNDYGLQVKGLKPGRYEVRLGGKKVAVYSADELAKGVNLAEAALTAGPVADQVHKVWEAVERQVGYFHDKVFRGVVLAGTNSPLFKGVEAAEREKTRQTMYEERMRLMPELDAAIRDALTMRPYVVEIVPAEQ